MTKMSSHQKSRDAPKPARPLDPTAASRKQRERDRAKELGLVRVEVYVPPKHRDLVREFARELCE